MSDPLTNIEIEDVLSSIRRLVSEDSGQPRRAPRPEKLVLTPSFLVAVPKDPVEEPVPLAEVAAPLPDETAPESGGWFLAAGGEVQQADDLGLAPDEGAALNSADVDVDMAVEVIGEDFAGEILVGPAEAMADMPGSQSYEAESYDDQSYEARSDEALFVAEAVVEASGNGGEAAAEDAVSHFMHSMAEEEGTEEPEIVFGAALRRRTLEAQIAELEEAVVNSADEFEPDGSEDQSAHRPTEVPRAIADRIGAARMSFEDASEAAQGAVDVEANMMADIDESSDDDETILDEESLRDLVAELVRVELRGELGERITRNVRRLVRREVQRALTLKHFAEDE